MTMTQTAQTTQVYQLYIRATPEQVWDAITNPTTIAKYFHGAQVDEGPLEVGAARTSWSPDRSQLWGDNTILECDPPRRFAWAVGDPARPSATWRFTLKPDGEGTRLEQWYQMGPARSGLNIAIDAMPDKEQKIVFVRLREHETGMKHNLELIKDQAERAG